MPRCFCNPPSAVLTSLRWKFWKAPYKSLSELSLKALQRLQQKPWKTSQWSFGKPAIEAFECFLRKFGKVSTCSVAKLLSKSLESLHHKIRKAFTRSFRELTLKALEAYEFSYPCYFTYISFEKHLTKALESFLQLFWRFTPEALQCILWKL